MKMNEGAILIISALYVHLYGRDHRNSCLEISSQK